MNKHILYWYRWGNEKPGYVSTWKIGKDGSVIHCGYKRMADIWRMPQGQVFHRCPYN